MPPDQKGGPDGIDLTADFAREHGAPITSFLEASVYRREMVGVGSGSTGHSWARFPARNRSAVRITVRLPAMLAAIPTISGHCRMRIP